MWPQTRTSIVFAASETDNETVGEDAGFIPCVLQFKLRRSGTRTTPDEGRRSPPRAAPLDWLVGAHMVTRRCQASNAVW